MPRAFAHRAIISASAVGQPPAATTWVRPVRMFSTVEEHGLICPLCPLEGSSPGLGRSTLRDDVNDDYASLLSGLDVTIGIGNRGERISPIDDRNESARFDLVFQIVHKCLSASAPRQGNDDAPASRELRRKQEQQIL